MTPQELRQKKWEKALVDKTIVSVDAEAANLVVLKMSDGSKVELEADTFSVGNGLFMPCILVPEEAEEVGSESGPPYDAATATGMYDGW